MTIVKKRKDRTAPEGYCEVTDFIYRNWVNNNGIKYAFTAEDCRQIKWLLNNYGKIITLSLCKLFWDEPDRWVEMNVGKSIVGLMHCRSKLLDDPKLKLIMNHFETIEKQLNQVESDPTRPDPSNLITLKHSPPKENEQDKKMDAIQFLNNLLNGKRIT